jgi:hypothetical protein
MSLPNSRVKSSNLRLVFASTVITGSVPVGGSSNILFLLNPRSF